MILNNPNFGIITGKLRISPKDAKKMFNFKMKPNEKFIVFRRYKNRCIICHYSKTTPKYKTQLKYAKAMAKLSKIYKEKEKIHKEWEKATKNKKYGPCAGFIKQNINYFVKKGRLWLYPKEENG